MPATLIDIIRHGQPVGGHRYRGNGVDDPLSDKGWRQMWATVGDTAPWSRIISSPMRRCSAFAQALAERHRLPLNIDERLREVGFGAWEGQRPADIVARDPDAFAAFYRDPVHNRPGGAEPLEDFGQRVGAAIEAVLARCPGEHLLIVAHAGVIRAALGHVLRADLLAWYRTKVPNAAITRFQLGEHGLQLVFHNRARLG